CDDETGIDASTEERAQRYVGNHPHAHRFVESFPQTRSRRCLAYLRGLSGLEFGHAPVASLANAAAIHRILQPATRLELAHVAEGAERIGNVAELEIQAKRIAVLFERNPGGPQALQFAGEIETAGLSGIVERLLSETVAREKDLSCARI